MSEQKRDEQEVEHRIVKAFEGPHSIWRTPSGIARTSGLSLSEVQAFIETHPQLFRKSEIEPAGKPLYTVVRVVAAEEEESEAQ